MFVSALSFTAQYRAFFQQKDPRTLFASAETRLFTAITLAAIWIITLDLYFTDHYESLTDSLRHSSFQVVSIISTTGFGTVDFDAWPHFSRLMMVSIMIIGGCAGSTAGGIKAVRLYVVIKYAGNQLRRLIRPRLVQPLYIGDREVSRDTTEGIIGFLMLYAAMTLLGALVLTALGSDFESGTTASVSAMNSIGPGLGSVGASQNFGHIAAAGKYVLSFEMLLGRLEIYTLLVIFVPHFWRRG
jgi:trk system potassium uptake protein TrkH